MAFTSSASAPSSGMMDSVRSFLASWIAVIKTRVDIVSLEIEEQREWMQQMVLLAVAALFCVSLGLILATLWVVVFLWDKQGRLWVFGGFALLYLIGATVLALSLRHKIKSKPKIFSTTAGELSKDYAALQPRAP
jgi:uncharacterized membrane protein YqjE